MFTFLPSPSLPFQPNPSGCRKATIIRATTPSKPPSPAVKAIAEALRVDIPSLFSPDPPESQTQNETQIYSPDVTFEDPLNKFRGLKRYESNIAFLKNSPVFSKTTLTLHNLAYHSTKPDTIRTRWTLSMRANLPWRPVISFTGQSDYVVDLASSTVTRHIDYWDSLADSTYFSFPAVKDLLSQCTPRLLSPYAQPAFVLLRRTPHLQIRSYSTPRRAGIMLRPAPEPSPVRVWLAANPGAELSDDESHTCLVVHVAVISLDNALASMEDFQSLVDRVRALLEGVSYAKVGDRAFYVPAFAHFKRLHEVWVELSEANANVDF